MCQEAVQRAPSVDLITFGIEAPIVKEEEVVEVPAEQTKQETLLESELHQEKEIHLVLAGLPLPKLENEAEPVDRLSFKEGSLLADQATATDLHLSVRDELQLHLQKTSEAAQEQQII